MPSDLKALKDIEAQLDQTITNLEFNQMFTPEEFKFYRENPDAFLEKELGIQLFDNTFSGLTPEEYKIMEEYCAQYDMSVYVENNHRRFVKSFADLNVLYWIVGGARGSGKTYILSGLIVWACLFLPQEFNSKYFINVVAGTKEQALEMYEKGVKQHIKRVRIGQYVTGKALKSHIGFSTGGEVEILTGSEKSVRHGHPHWLIIDEGAELDKKEGAAVTYSALEQISSSLHGRVSMTSTMHFLAGAFGEFWDEYLTKGYKKAQWDMIPGHRPWIPFAKQVQEFEQMKLHSANFPVAALARPELSAELEFPIALVKEAKMNTEVFNYYKELIANKKYIEAWMSFDWGYSPHITVLTLWFKFEDGMVVIWKQEGYEKASEQKIVSKAQTYLELYDMTRLYCDSRGGPHYVDALKKASFRVNEVDFGQGHKDGLSMRLLQLLQIHGLMISPMCEILLRALPKVHRDDDGKIVEFLEDDYPDSVFAGVEPLAKRFPVKYISPMLDALRPKTTTDGEKIEKGSDLNYFGRRIHESFH